MQFIDSHSHIYLQDFAADFDNTLLRAQKEGIKIILMPAIDAATHEQMLEVERNYPVMCRAMMGLHPCSVKENFREELRVAEEYFQSRMFVAVGETGLDFYWDQTYIKQQYEAFERQIEWAMHFDIPVVIHSRNSMEECIKVVAAHQKGKLKGVFHCFSGSEEQAKKIIDLGFYLGIGGVLTFKNSGLDKVLRAISLDHMILETDAPYLAPAPFRGKRNEPSYLKYVAEKLAEIKQCSKEMIATITTANGEKLFGL